MTSKSLKHNNNNNNNESKQATNNKSSKRNEGKASLSGPLIYLESENQEKEYWCVLQQNKLLCYEKILQITLPKLKFHYFQQLQLIPSLIILLLIALIIIIIIIIIIELILVLSMDSKLL